MPRVLLITEEQELEFIKSMGIMKRYLDLLLSSLYCNIEDGKQISTTRLKDFIGDIFNDLTTSENCILKDWDSISVRQLKERFEAVNNIFVEED